MLNIKLIIIIFGVDREKNLVLIPPTSLAWQDCFLGAVHYIACSISTQHGGLYCKDNALHLKCCLAM